MAYDPFRPAPPLPEPVEGRTLPIYLVEDDEEPAARPAWVRWAAALLAATLVILGFLSALDLGINPPRPVPVGR